MQKVQFKQYNEGEVLLFPDRLDSTISENHLVRIINHTVNQLDLTFLISTYSGGGTTAYHPRMLLKILLYAYCLKLYTGRKIANALRSDITFMWLSGKQYPDFRTINNFRSGRLKDSIHTVFKSLLLLMFTEGYIRLEEYYCDGRFAAFKHAGDATDYTAPGGGSGLWHVHQDDGEQRNRPGGD